MRPPSLLVFWTVSVVFASSSSAAIEEYPNGYQVCTFTAPTVMKNWGQKLVVLYALDPKSQKWVWVWDKHTAWLSDYLAFPVPRSSPHFSDNVHYGDSLKVLRPITIAFSGFKDGPVRVEFSAPPTKHTTLKKLPGKPKESPVYSN